MMDFGQVVSNLYKFLTFVEHKRRYFEVVDNQTIDGPHWILYCGKKYYGIQQKTETHTGLEQR